MKHLVFFVHLVSFMLGGITIALSLLAYRRYKSRLVKYYTCFLIAMSTVLLERLVTFYRLASVVSVQYLEVIFWIISCLGSGLLMYSLPLLMHDILKLQLPERKRLLFGMLAYLPIVSLVLYYTLPYKVTVLTVISTIVFLNLLYCVCLGAVHLKTVKRPEVKAVMKTFLLVFGLWIPFEILESKVEQVEVLRRTFPYGLLAVPLFYLVWNILSLYFGYKYFGSFVDTQSADQKGSMVIALEQDKVDGRFYEKYKITNREKEVILLLAKGYSYNRISEELVISLTTARTHIYNIYQKTGAKNKVELINLMKSDTPA